MKLATMGIDLGALALVASSAFKILPGTIGIVAGVLGAIYYGFVIWDRIKYGPETEGRHKTVKIKIDTVDHP